MALPADPSDFLGIQRQDEDQKLDQNPQSTFSIALPSDCGTYCTCHCSIKATVEMEKATDEHCTYTVRMYNRSKEQK